MITIQEETTKNPISLIGKEAGTCYGSNVEDADKNYKRGYECITSGHGRTLEYPQIYMVIDGCSARVAREIFTHIAGGPTRLQASTRYINYENFEYITPPSIDRDSEAFDSYVTAIRQIQKSMAELQALDIPREDIGMLLPLCMTTKIVMRTNLRHLIDMSRQRMCSRAYWEFRQLMNEMIEALRQYGNEWKVLTDELQVFHPKCEDTGYCREAKCCGRRPKLET